MKKKVTMQDIADMVGVTKSTISRYFNGGYVKEETRETIKNVIEKYNYEPNAFAQSLKAKESKIIGVIAPCLDSTVSGRMLMAIDEYLRKHNYTSLFINTNHNEQLELNSLESLWRMKVDGIILLATHISEQHDVLVQRLDVPVLFVAQKYQKGISIVHDDYNAGVMVGAYAGEMKHKDVVFMSVDEHDVAVGRQRRQGVLDGLAQNNIDKVNVIECDFSYEQAVTLIDKVLQTQLPDLIICSTDRQAMGAYRAIQERGLRIPEDISVIGFGGYDVSAILTPRLTTVKFDSATVGYLAGETILKMIKDEPVSKLQVVDFTLQEGTSVAKL